MAFKRGLAYTGVAQPTPPNQVIMDRSPTSQDYQGFNIGDRWIVPEQSSGPSEQEWILMSKAQGVAVWIDAISGGSATYPNHELLVGSGTSTINSIPHGNSGETLISGGAGSDPAFGNLTVAHGGTSVTSFTAYTPICGGTTTTGALQSVASLGNAGDILTSNGAGVLPSFQAPGATTLTVPQGGTGDTSFLAYAVVTGGITNVDPLQTVASLGTTGQVLTSQGNGSLPIWTDNAAAAGFSSIVTQVFTSNGTYTPTANMKYCVVEALGGGGGAGGVGDNISLAFASAGGGAGGYCRKVIDAATIGVSQTVTIGAAGAGGANGSASGTTGGATTFGAILTANGGAGSAGVTVTKAYAGGAGGTASGGDINIPGQSGGMAYMVSGNGGFSGIGANSPYGSGGNALVFNAVSAGNPGLGYGSGGGGAMVNAITTRAGGAGATGLVIVTEFVGS